MSVLCCDIIIYVVSKPSESSEVRDSVTAQTQSQTVSQSQTASQSQSQQQGSEEDDDTVYDESSECMVTAIGSHSNAAAVPSEKMNRSQCPLH